MPNLPWQGQLATAHKAGLPQVRRFRQMPRDRGYIYRRSRKGRRRRGRNTASLTIQHLSDLPADGDAVKCLEHIGDAVLRALRQGFEREVIPASGQGVGVGFQTGHLARNITRGTISGNESRAHCEIVAPSDRWDWLEAEAKRGHEWFSVDGRVGEVIQEALDEFTREGLRKVHPAAKRGPKKSGAA